MSSKSVVHHGEVAREVISEEQEKKSTNVPYIDNPGFTKLVVKRIKKTFDDATGDKFNLYDRGLPDSVAYLKVIDKTEPDKELHDELLNSRYENIVFFTPIWEQIYNTDKQRLEWIIEARKISNALIEVYHNYNYNLIEVPIGPVKDRVKFVLKTMKKYAVDKQLTSFFQAQIV